MSEQTENREQNVGENKQGCDDVKEITNAMIMRELQSFQETYTEDINQIKMSQATIMTAIMGMFLMLNEGAEKLGLNAMQELIVRESLDTLSQTVEHIQRTVMGDEGYENMAHGVHVIEVKSPEELQEILQRFIK